MSSFFLLIFLLLINAFFSLSEVVFIAVKKTKLQLLRDKGNRRAKIALSLIERPELFLSTVQIAITLVSLLFGYFSLEVCGSYVADFLRSLSIDFYVEEITSVSVVILATYFSSLFAEIVPKRIGIFYADSLALNVAYPIFFSLQILYPLVWFLSKSSNLIFSFLGIKRQKTSSFTEHEIKNILYESQKEGNIDEEERDIIERIFNLGDRNITSLMLHRQQLIYFQMNDTVKYARERVLENPHYHYPVCEGDLDNLKGIITLKEIYANGNDKTKLSKLMRKPMIVPETITAYSVMEQMKDSHQQICFVVDEYGSVEGMLTLTHILEAIVGDIPISDETTPSIIQMKNKSYLVEGTTSFYEFLDFFNREQYHNPELEESDEYDTVAGFFIYQLERIPNEGDTIEWKEFRFQIVDMDGHRIDKIIVDVKKVANKEKRD